MKLHLANKPYEFSPVRLKFNQIGLENVFAEKNNKTLRETISTPKYEKFSAIVFARYQDYLGWGLGRFLYYLKRNGDLFYQQFLNKYGDLTYLEFAVDDEVILGLRGLYVYTVGDRLQYIGRCRDSFKKRINQGYGKIHPKNCYIDGQATNCHLNNLIFLNRDVISLMVCPMESVVEIEEVEKEAIRRYSPSWNIQR